VQVTHGTATSMHMPCLHLARFQYLAIDSPTWHFSKSYFLASRTAVQHDCLALMWRTVLAVQRRHWSPWTCGAHTTLTKELQRVCCVALLEAGSRL
jgi:hypothetical protein